MKAGAARRPVPCVPSWECARGSFVAMFGQKKIAFGNFGFPNAISFWVVVEMRTWRVRSAGGLAAA